MKRINKKEIFIFFFVLIFAVIIFLPWLKGHLATDTYKIYDIGYKEAAIGSLNDGRVVMYLLANIANIFNIPVNIYVSILLVLALIISTCSVMLIRKIILQYRAEKGIWETVITTILAYITIFNFMYIENLYFAEAFVMAISIFLNMYAAKIMADSNKGFVIKSIVLLLISVFMYQGTVGIFVAIYVMLLLMKHEKNFKLIISKFIFGIMILAIILLTNIIFVKMMNNIIGIQQNRVGNFSNILYNIIVIFIKMPEILQNTCGLFPENFLLYFLLAVIILNLISMIKIKEERHMIINFWIIMIMTILSGFATYILSLTSFWAGRLRFSIGALIGILLMYLFCKGSEFNKKGIIRIVFIVILFIYAILNIVNYVFIINEHLKVNKLEEEIVLELGKQIEVYEQSGKNVNNVYMVIYTNQASKTCDESIKIHSFTTYNALRCSWSSLAVINYYLQEEFTGQFITENAYYEALEKNNLEDEEFVFIDNSVFVKIYMP